MPGLADFVESLLRGALLASLALFLGGVAWGIWGLRGWRSGTTPPAVVRRCLIVLGASALGAAACQTALLGLRTFTLTEDFGSGIFAAYLRTGQFAAGASRAVLALGAAATAGRLTRRPSRVVGWAMLAILSLLLALTGGVSSHAWARLHHRELLTTLTVLHQLGALIWAGALVHLGLLWRLARRDRVVESMWPEFVVRFSGLAMVSVLLLVVAGVPLAWIYASSPGSLIGTGFGSLILAKCLLLSAALLLASFNFASARVRAGGAVAVSMHTRLPYLVEAEAIIVGMVLFAAVALSAQPPGSDLSAADRAELREVAEVFRPKLPSLETPSLEEIHRQRSATHGDERSREAYLWSNFSHNVAGLILLPMSLVALAGPLGWAHWSRHWPLGFVALAAFIYLRAAANDGVWPFGSFGRAEVDAEALQHLLAAGLVLALGLFEWWARSNEKRPAWSYVFPLLAMTGGILLLTHSHTAFEPKPAFLVQVTHSAIGALAGLIAAGRWLELRLAPPGSRVAGAVAGSAMLAIALVLVFYREANVVIPR